MGARRFYGATECAKPKPLVFPLKAQVWSLMARGQTLTAYEQIMVHQRKAAGRPNSGAAMKRRAR